MLCLLDMIGIVIVQNAGSSSGPVSEKALYALSSLISNNHEGHLQFYNAGGVAAIKHLLANAYSHSQLRKLLNLITNLMDVHGEVEVCPSAAKSASRRLDQAIPMHEENRITGLIS